MKTKLFIIALLLSGAAYGQIEGTSNVLPDELVDRIRKALDFPVERDYEHEALYLLSYADFKGHAVMDIRLKKLYLDYCYADSVNIGFEYRYNIVESDRGGSYSLIEVYYYYYADRLPTAEINSLCTDYYGPEGDPVGTWRWYHDWYRRKHPQYYQYIPLEYTKVIPIREPSKLPTFKGYVEWLDKLLTK